MKKLLACLMFAAAVAVPAQAEVLFGYQTWQPGTDSPVRGPIRFDSDNTSNATLLANCSNMGVVYGGYYLDYHWYGQVIKQGTQSTVDAFYEIDMTTGERTRVSNGGAKLIDITVDYPSGRIFGIRNGNSILAELNPTTGENTPIVRFSYGGSDVYMLACAAGLDGKIYLVSSDDRFFSIVPDEGTLTLVGNLGVDAGYDQTMAFDHNNGVLYWVNNADYSLYTIDTATGAATAVGKVGTDGNGSMGSLFAPYIHVAKGAPDRVTAASASASGSNVTITWTNPSTTAQGAPLAELTSVIVMRNDVQVAEVTEGIAVGSVSSFTDTGLADGATCLYKLIPVNSAGSGGVDSRAIQVAVGKELPGAPANFKAAQGDGSAILSWELPAAGISGGSYDAAAITGWQIGRDGTKVAVTSADKLNYEDVASFGTHAYTVAAVTADGTGAEARIEGVMVKPAAWIVMTDGTATLDAGTTYKFYDNGGPDANYNNSLSYTLTICPADADSYVNVDFESFDLESYDSLSIYDGVSADAPLIGKFAGRALPPALAHVESTTADGSLTFVFKSDVMENYAGWVASAYTAKRQAYDLEMCGLSASAFAVVSEKSVAVATIRNKGTNRASAFSVSLLAGAEQLATVSVTELAAGASMAVELEYTPAQAGDITLQAVIDFEADAVSDNNASAPVAQRVLPAGSDVVDLAHETPSALYVVPASFMSFESICQSLITADEIASGAGKQLTMLSFPLQTADNAYSAVPFRLWVGETDRADLVDGTIPASQLTEVFHGTVDIATGASEITFAFETPFAYNGGNLVYMLHKENSTAENSGVTFRGCYGSAACAHAKCTRYTSKWDHEDTTPLDPEASFGYSADNTRADVRLFFSTAGAGIGDAAVEAAGAARGVQGGIFCPSAAVIYNAAGAPVATAAAGTTAALTPGIYIVQTAVGATKVAVK